MLRAMHPSPTLASPSPFFASSESSLDAARMNGHIAILKNQSGEFRRRQRAPRSHVLVDDSQNVVGQLVGSPRSRSCRNQADEPQTLKGRQGLVKAGPREAESLGRF